MSFPLTRLAEAIKEAKEKCKPRRFTQSVELIVTFRDLDVKKPENRLNLTVVLPHPPKNKIPKVAVIASGDLALKAKEAGADLVIDRDELAKIASDKKQVKKIASEYDFFFAQADMMPLVGRFLGRYLGPRGKMPTPIPPTADISAFIERARKSIRLRMRNQPQVMCRIGSEEQSSEEIVRNAEEVLNAITKRIDPRHISKVYIKLTMGPVVEVKRR